MKYCTKCKREKDFCDFYRDACKKDGLTCRCKECVKEDQKEYEPRDKEKAAERAKDWAQRNKEKRAAQERARILANPEKHAAYRKEWNAKNREKLCGYSKKWRAANPEKTAETNRAWKAANPERRAATGAAWNEKNPGSRTTIARNRRARVRKADGSHTAAEVKGIFDSQRGLCAGCPAKLIKSGKNKFHVDHIQPISKGGSNDKYNLQCLCPECNLRKYNKDPEQWAKENGKLL